jgi:glycerol kinase
VKVILALDQGTTSSRAIVFGGAGEVIAIAQKEFRQIFPQPGWVEHDPQEIWTSQISVAHEALAKAQVSAKNVAAIGIANQRETTILWDRATGKPVANAIVWQDRRTAGICEALVARGLSGLIQEKTGLVIDAYFSATKLAWLLDHIPDCRRRAENGELAFGTVDTWLAWNLSGGALHVTDPSNASRTMLFDIRRGDWDDELLALFNIPRSVLPDVKASSEVYGTTSAEAFATPIPIAGIAGDQQAALFGQMCLTPGMAKNTYGTGCFMLMNTGSEPVTSAQKLLTTVGWNLRGKLSYALEGSVFVAGAVVQWLRDGLGLIRTAADVEALAASVSDNGGVYLVPALTGLGAPHWDPHARGAIVGITRGTTAAHLARAALEGIAHQVADVLDAMQQDAKTQLTVLRVDGGASQNNLLMQIQADLLGVPVIRPRITETTALGAAYLAGLAVGYWRDIDQISSQWQPDKVFDPQISRNALSDHRGNWKSALARVIATDRNGDKALRREC